MSKLVIQGTVLTPEDGDAYAAAIRRNSDLSQLPAKLVAQPVTYTDVVDIIAYAKSQTPPIEVAVKGGGAHPATWASSDGGIVVDLSKLKDVTVLTDKKSVVVQGGALWGDVYEVLSKEELDVVGSPLWFVGVGGYTLGGGYGPLSGTHGLAIDNLLSATVILADGRIVEASANSEPELFWAIRGGGGQFGLVVEFTFKLYPSSGPYGTGVIVYPGDEMENVIKVIQGWKAGQTPFERFTINFSRSAPHWKPSIVMLPWVAHDENGERSKTVLKPFLDGPIKPVFQRLATVPNMLVVSHGADASLGTAPRRLSIRGTLFSDFFPELLLGVWQRWVEFTEGNEDVRSSTVIWDLTSPKKLAEINVADTALKTRVPHYWMVVQGRSTTDASTPTANDFAKSITSYVREKNATLSGTDLGFFVNMAGGDEPPETVFGEQLPRLRRAKARYDPGNFWTKGFPIEPARD
ncbi:FAD-binding domain-containing protein [Vararia minispora EC-137]|uniref:FAD-binding domain-containing protein n=1 Tax=Vararia minispora EC-137 TaxID=1314806 RepID=A0ACB8QE63_9AGAM|nr:FAD-binding domain-containing protein [Vararia minispora EC-137]